jgi:CheY-like chemotaxis protein
MDRNRPYVLVVDGTADGADSTSELLIAWGYDAGAEYSGPAALDAARGRMPFAVILDLGIAPMDGFAFAVLFRSMPGSGESLIVAISGRAAEMRRSDQPHPAIDHQLPKPADATALRSLLERYRTEYFAGPIRVRGTARHATPMRPPAGRIIAAYAG